MPSEQETSSLELEKLPADSTTEYVPIIELKKENQLHLLDQGAIEKDILINQLGADKFKGQVTLARRSNSGDFISYSPETIKKVNEIFDEQQKRYNLTAYNGAPLQNEFIDPYDYAAQNISKDLQFSSLVETSREVMESHETLEPIITKNINKTIKHFN